MRLRIAARSSDLARAQAFQVAGALKAAQSDLEIEFEFRASLGDENLDLPLSEMPAKGVFTEDFFLDLKSGRFDMVVHSWKDLPTEERAGTRIAATLERADCRDLLLVPNLAWEKARKLGKLKVLSSSPRRAHNLQGFHELLPKGIASIEFTTVRGNVPTRIDKMFSESAGLVVAKAAIDRLLSAPESEFQKIKTELRQKLTTCRFMVLPVSLNPPAAAQGALAIEIADEKNDLQALLDKINAPNDFQVVLEERAILQSHGGGCHQKIGVAVLSKTFGKWTTVRGVTERGAVLNENRLESAHHLPRAKSMDRIFPGSVTDNSWFSRQPIPVAKINADAVWAARAEAWPAGLQFGGVVWTSGVASWKKLASDGIWVHGCSEGLGSEDPRLDAICGNLKWLKLTHTESPEVAAMPVLSTYKLVAKDKTASPNLRGKTHFYWMSSTSFQRAFSLFPKDIEAGYHGCGPGLTYEFIRQQKLHNRPKIFLNLEAFLHETIPS